MSDIDICFDDSTAFVQPDEPSIDEVAPIYSKTASRRTVAKYLKRKTTISRLIAKEQKIVDNIKIESIDSNDNLIKLEADKPQIAFQFPYFNDNYNQELTPMMFSPNMSSFMNNNLVQHNKENNSSISDMLKCVLDCNKGFIESLEMNNDFPNSWMASGLPFDCYQPHLSSSGLSASIDKQEREIAYNLLLRRLIDETLDRNVIFSHQPKELLNLINSVLVRQFPEYEDFKHRSKVRSYLKACRRNSKKNNGRIIMKNTAAYLSSGPGNRLMHQIYNSEKEMIDLIKKESEKFRLTQISKQSHIQSEPLSMVKPSQQQQILNITNSLPQILPISMHSLQPNIKPLHQVYTSKPSITVNQLPLLLPINSGNTSYESAPKSVHKTEPSVSNDVIKNISEIVKSFVSSDCSLNVVELITQLTSTANFLERFAKTLEKSCSSPGNN